LDTHDIVTLIISSNIRVHVIDHTTIALLSVLPEGAGVDIDTSVGG